MIALISHANKVLMWIIQRRLEVFRIAIGKAAMGGLTSWTDTCVVPLKVSSLTSEKS